MRRDKLKVLVGILEICRDSDGMNKTKIVYQTNINFKIASLYMDMLIKEELVKVINPGPREKYTTTDKGIELLENIKDIYDRMEQYPLEMKAAQ